MIAALTLITATSSFAQQRNGGRYGNGGFGNGGYGQGQYGQGQYGQGQYGQGQYGQQGQQRIQLHIQQHLKGLNIIKIKKEIKMQHPGINIQTLKIKAVKVVAKSKMGRGQATLLVGQSASYPQTIMGNPRTFDYGGPHSFAKLMIQNPSRSSQGRVQLELKGNIKLKKIVVIAKQMQRAQNVVIHMSGQTLQGFNVIKLKKMLKMQNPGLDLFNAKLKKVTLIAKSKMGRGQATLLVGQSASYPETVFGNPRSFEYGGPRSFSQVVLQNPAGPQSQGKWQVELKGKIKVQKIIVTLKGLQGQGGYGGHMPPRPRRRN